MGGVLDTDYFCFLPGLPDPSTARVGLGRAALGDCFGACARGALAAEPGDGLGAGLGLVMWFAPRCSLEGRIECTFPPMVTPASDDEAGAIYALAYKEAVRVLEGQAVTLEQIRGRLTTVLAVATTASAFLVGVVAKANSVDQTAPYWTGVAIGILLYACLLVRTVQILRPTYEWHFNLSPKGIIEGYADAEPPATLAETHRLLALFHDENIVHNEGHLSTMRNRLDQSLWIFILEIACWAWLTATVG